MEEDINTLKHFIINAKNTTLLNGSIYCYEVRANQLKALENILTDYEQKLKALDKAEDFIKQLGRYLDDLRNERAELVDKVQELKNDLEHDGLAHKYLTLKATSIPKQVIRDEIEKLEKDAEKIREKKKDAYDSDRSKSRLQAYLTKTNEIAERLKELLK